MPVREYSKRVDMLDLDLQMCDDDSINICVMSTFQPTFTVLIKCCSDSISALSLPLKVQYWPFGALMMGLCLTHSQRGGIKREKSQLQQAVFKGVKRHGREAMVIQKMLAIPLKQFQSHRNVF